MQTALHELKVACPKCSQHCVVPCAEVSLQITCPACGEAFVPADVSRVRSNGEIADCMRARFQTTPPTVVRAQSPLEKLETKARQTVMFAWVLLFLGLAVLLLGVFVSVSDDSSAALFGCANFFAGCVAVAFMLAVIGQLIHIRAALESKR